MNFEIDNELQARFKILCVKLNKSMGGVLEELIEGWIKKYEL